MEQQLCTIGGAVDWKVPILNAELHYLARIVDWFDRYLAASTTTSASTAR